MPYSFLIFETQTVEAFQGDQNPEIYTRSTTHSEFNTVNGYMTAGTHAVKLVVTKVVGEPNKGVVDFNVETYLDDVLVRTEIETIDVGCFFGRASIAVNAPAGIKNVSLTMAGGTSPEGISGCDLIASLTYPEMTFTVGTPVSYFPTWTPSNWQESSDGPPSFEAIAIPDGLSVDSTTGEISGTPTTSGTTAARVSLRFGIPEKAVYNFVAAVRS